MPSMAICGRLEIDHINVLREINKVQSTRKQNKQKTQTKSKERMMLTNLIAAPQPVYPIEPLMQSPSSFAKF